MLGLYYRSGERYFLAETALNDHHHSYEALVKIAGSISIGNFFEDKDIASAIDELINKSVSATNNVNLLNKLSMFLLPPIFLVSQFIIGLPNVSLFFVFAVFVSSKFNSTSAFFRSIIM